MRGDPAPWLLELENPSVRYLALRHLLDYPDDNPEVVAARKAIADWPLVHLVLRKQQPDGRWGARERAYGDTLWRLLFLALLGVEATPSIRRGCDYVLDRGALPEGGFSFNGQRSGYLPCFTANAVFLLCRFGYADDPRVGRAVSSLVESQLGEGGWLCSGRTHKTHSCLWATAKVLRAFSCLPRGMKTTPVVASEQVALELFLTSGLYNANRSDYGPPHSHWFQCGFPLLLESDVLEVLSLVAPFASPDDPRIQEGLALVLAKQDDAGRWPMEKSVFLRRNGAIAWQLADASDLAMLRQRFGGEEFGMLGQIGQPNKWVTLAACRMLKQLYVKQHDRRPLTQEAREGPAEAGRALEGG